MAEALQPIKPSGAPGFIQATGLSLYSPSVQRGGSIQNNLAVTQLTLLTVGLC